MFRLNRTACLHLLLALATLALAALTGHYGENRPFLIFVYWVMFSIFGTFGVLGGTYFIVEDVSSVLKGIRERDGTITWDAIQRHVRGISLYAWTQGSGKALSAVQRIYPDGTTMSEDAVREVFEQGTTAEVRASLGYLDGKTWFEEAPAGLLVAEMMFRTGRFTKVPTAESLFAEVKERVREKDDLRGERLMCGYHARNLESKHLYEVREATDRLFPEYEVLAVTFARPDLLAAIALARVGRLGLWAPLSRIDWAERKLSGNMLDALLQVLEADDLNRTIRTPNAIVALWMALFERLECEPRNYKQVLVRFVTAGATYEFDVPKKYKTLRGRQRLAEAIEYVRKNREALKAKRKQSGVLAIANGYTPHEANAALVRSILAEPAHRN